MGFALVTANVTRDSSKPCIRVVISSITVCSFFVATDVGRAVVWECAVCLVPLLVMKLDSILTNNV